MKLLEQARKLLKESCKKNSIIVDLNEMQRGFKPGKDLDYRVKNARRIFAKAVAVFW